MEKGTEIILIVDDEPTLVQLGEKILTALGYKILTACNGDDACRIYQESKDEIDLVILDVVMPGMSGEEIFHRLREINPQVRVLLSSGYSQEEKPQSLIDQGVQGFIQKPYVMKVLANAVRDALIQPA
jgi:DNA-binding NtrC family response regulator